MTDSASLEITSAFSSTTMVASNDRSQVANLQALAAELHIEIAGYLDNQDIIALRQICRALAKNTLDIFAERFFSSRRHAVTTHSLRALRDISHTRVFARHVRTVELVTIGVNRYEGCLSTREETAKSWYNEERKELVLCRQALLLEIFRELAALELSLSVSLNPEIWTDDTRRSYTRAHCVDPQEELRTLWSSSKGTHGMKHLYQRVWPWASKRNIWTNEIEPAINDINQVMSELPKLLAELHVAWSKFPALGGTQLFTDMSANQLAKMRVSWANLSSLHLTLGLRAHLPVGDLGMMLLLAVNLRYLAIRSQDHEGIDALREAVGNMTLSTLRLGSEPCSADSLCQLLQSQRETLRHLELDGVLLQSEDHSWHDVFGHMSKELQLDSFWARRLGTDYPGHIYQIRADPEDEVFWLASDENMTVAELLSN